MKRWLYLLLMCMLALSSCASLLRTDAPMERFSFSHAGMRSDSCYTLTAEKTDDGWQAHFDLFCTQEFTLPMSQEDADMLYGLLDACNLWKWNGFHKVDKTVSDGKSFWLNVSFADGRKLSASGGHRFPDDYGAAVNAIKAVFIQIMENNGMDNPF